jgi:L-ascorbate metabolism protein UlaG (beta-lactamase superfamily)
MRPFRKAGQWFVVSRQWAPRLIGGFFRELTRPMVQPKFRPTPAVWNPALITASWLGHASVLINFYGLTLLTDPVLSRRIGATVGRATLGPRRLVAPALTFRELPAIDVILISHAHLDHLHRATLQLFPASTRVVTAGGTKDLFIGTKLHDVHELSWGEHVTIATHHGDISIEAFEVKHWGARWRRDRPRGYNGYILERNQKKILFGGDTGYTESFKKLRVKGPFEFAVMPIGSYKPGEWSHCTPEEAAAMANDAGAKYLLPIHHQTFCYSRAESQTEPIERLLRIFEPDRIALREIGETFCTN